MVAPVDHVLPVTLDEVNVTEPPEQKAVGPLAVIVGVIGNGLTVTDVGFDDELQFPLETTTEYEPAVETIIDCVVAPVDHVLPVTLDEVNVTEPPEQKAVGPLAEIVGVIGNGLTVTVVGLDDEVQFPLETTTEYEPAVETVMDCEV